MRISQLFSCIIVLALPGTVSRCVAQQAPGSYGLIAPWGTQGPNGQIIPQSQPDAGENKVPVGLGEPIDPLTGLPLRMTSLANSGGSGQAPRIDDIAPAIPRPIDSPPGFPGTPSTHRADTAQQRAGQTHGQPSPPGPVLRPNDLLPALPAPPQNPLIPPSIIDPFQLQELYQNRSSASGPVNFGGGIEILDDGSGLSFPELPQPNPLIPLPRLDPPLFDSGNRNGELDWIDLIEEYAGRATRSDIPRDPALTHPQDRSWLRLEHWHADANGEAAVSSDDFGLATFYGGVTVGLPKIRGITVTPSVALHEGLGSAKTKLEKQLFDLQVEFAWMHQIDERWRMRVELGAGLFSDFQIRKDLDALRITGLSLFTYEWSRDLQLVFGTAYLNLETQQFLPVAGIVWQPNDRLQFEILFPEWKLAGFVKEVREGEIWSYIGGGFYGRSWRIQQSTGAEDVATYSNWRVHLGWEKRHISGITYFGEIGYEFGRRLRFRSNVGDFDPGDLAFARVGMHY
ncbi:MAG: DUF6268 family outer membrane beta-barrel protein [Planctomycetota bacterium]|nr:DUF6268 family outer membrane beta-barrel protein [Planctomycetota bacterium]